MKKKLIIFFTIIFLGKIMFCFSNSAVDLQRGVVKLYVTKNQFNYYSPWQAPDQTQSYGSGFVIDDFRILTNAHVVANSVFIELRLSGSSKKYEAKVEVIGDDCDLAILRVEDASFTKEALSLEFGSMPRIGDKISVFGFPIGGDTLSVTSGIISRIEEVDYSHSFRKLIACQVDAPINPGNSGGPAFNGEKVCGVAFQGDTVGQNIGYIIPMPIVNHFLSDVKGKSYKGFPSLYLKTQSLENASLRENLKIHEGISGVLVYGLSRELESTGSILLGDIITQVEGKNIANDGTVELFDIVRTYADQVVALKHIGEKVELKIFRDNKLINVKVSLDYNEDQQRLVAYPRYGESPSYFIIGGMVFQPLSYNYMRSTWGSDWYYVADKSFLNYYKNGALSKDRDEVVILNRSLPDKINRGYQNFRNLVVKSVNGNPVPNMKEFISFFEIYQGQYHVIEFENGLKIILNRVKTKDNQYRILDKYKIVSDRSDNFKDST